MVLRRKKAFRAERAAGVLAAVGAQVLEAYPGSHLALLGDEGAHLAPACS
jgi:hypothetical protein